MPALQELSHPTVHRMLESPIGQLTVVTRGCEIVGLYFPHHWTCPDLATFGRVDDTVAEGARSQLDEYFASRLRSFDLRLSAVRGHITVSRGGRRTIASSSSKSLTSAGKVRRMVGGRGSRPSPRLLPQQALSGRRGVSLGSLCVGLRLGPSGSWGVSGGME